MILLFLWQTQKFKEKALLSLHEKRNFCLLVFGKICYVACAINCAGKLICLRACLRERDHAGLNESLNIEYFLVGCRVCCKEYGCKWFNAVVTSRSVWNIIKVKLNMFLRFLCCYSDENSFLFHHFYLLLSILNY